MREALMSETGDLRDHIVILKNGRPIGIFGGLNTKLENDDIIAIFPPVAGG